MNQPILTSNQRCFCHKVSVDQEPTRMLRHRLRLFEILSFVGKNSATQSTQKTHICSITSGVKGSNFENDILMMSQLGRSNCKVGRFFYRFQPSHDHFFCGTIHQIGTVPLSSHSLDAKKLTRDDSDQKKIVLDEKKPLRPFLMRRFQKKSSRAGFVHDSPKK